MWRDVRRAFVQLLSAALSLLLSRWLLELSTPQEDWRWFRRHVLAGIERATAPIDDGINWALLAYYRTLYESGGFVGDREEDK